jgi:hypothetical protein
MEAPIEAPGHLAKIAVGVPKRDFLRSYLKKWKGMIGPIQRALHVAEYDVDSAGPVGFGGGAEADRERCTDHRLPALAINTAGART